MKQKLEALRKELAEQFAKALEDASDKLDKAKQAYEDFASTVSDSLTGEFSVSQAADAAKEAGTSILDQLNQQASGAKQFGQQVEQLLAMGISEQALRNVLEAGQEAGSALASELIQGGSDAITGPNGINRLVEDLSFMANALGTMAANEFYLAGVTQGENYLAGVQAAVAQAEKLLKNPKLKLADLKGIGAKFSSDIGKISPASVQTDYSSGIADHMASRGVTNYSVNVNGGLASSAEIGQTVVNAIRAFNRTNGPASIQVS